MSHDLLAEYLPTLLGADARTGEVFTAAQMSNSHAADYKKGLERIEALPETSGSEMVILASSDRDKVFNKRELAENTLAAERLRRVLKSLGIPNTIKIMADYGRTDVEQILSDPNIGHLAFVGHTKRSGIYIPGEQLRWNNVSPGDHLKKSLGILGCGITDRLGATPRFGFNLIHPETGILYGKPHGGTFTGEVQDLGNFSRLSTRLKDQEL